MRIVIAGASLLLCVFSVFVDAAHPSYLPWLCEHGLCRFDQMFNNISSTRANPDGVAALVKADPANPMAWCTYGDSLALRGDTEKANAAFQHAIALGPDMPPVSMRAANFDFTHDRYDQGLALSKNILTQTSAFDQILFSYFTRPGVPVETVLALAIPVQLRPAHSWLDWVQINGSEQDISVTWSWMMANHFADEKTATEITWTFWRRGQFRTSQEFWADWLGAARGDYLRPELLANRSFKDAPRRVPFDWLINLPASIEISRSPGFTLRFSGNDNVFFDQPRQLTAVQPGSYGFSAEIQGDNLTTDECPYFYISDPANAGRVNIATSRICGTVARSWIHLDFAVPKGTESLAVQLERLQSRRFDGMIQGTLTIYEVSLVPAS